MSRTTRSTGLVWLLAALKCAAFVLALVVAALLCTCTGPVAAKAEDATTQAGQPLDAVRYPAPAFADGQWSWYVVDRRHMTAWWVVQLDGEPVVLPVGQVGP